MKAFEALLTTCCVTNSAHMITDLIKLPSLVLAVILYGVTLMLLCRGIFGHAVINKKQLASISLSASGLHLTGALLIIFSGHSVDFSLFASGSLIFAVTGAIITFSSLKKPVHALELFIVPISMGLIIASLVFQPTKLTELSPGVAVHVVLSILAYGLITIATASALVMSYASYQLKHKHIHSLGSLMPPLETIEKMLFEMILAGELFLTASIVSGVLFHVDFFAQHLIHKTFFSLLSWTIFAVLLAGHHFFGWRGNKAMKLTVSGFITLLLAYVGSKFVIEMILA